ncbi:type I secretion system permease/ATPase [Candidatus Methylospira mobilis]|uniref:type I secretion system permease/ATPase n=1 Tax=Candidatus Methylospira mobilis TaxID=1808979 RepID=UPI0028EC57B6|nr:type I secretion system permease/ATPase [Candidatus Methylospira mobilis]WNV05389.1 type I secretion system permease/ATPase [Candidatus Methylospira mobilis]
MINTQQTSEQVANLRVALLRCKQSFLSAGFLSFFINILILAPMIYMMQIYDRVMASSSVSTLTMLTVLLVFLLTVMGALEWVRSQILVVTSNRFDQMLSSRVFDAMFTTALPSSGRSATAQPLGDLLQLRQFLTGNGLFAFFDAPWLPLNIIVMWWFHWTFGVVALISAFLLMGLNLWNELATRDLLKKANDAAMDSSQHTQRNLRNIEVIEAMGMLPRLRARWQRKQNTLLTMQGKASGKAGLIMALSKLYRTVVQSLILGLGAYLAIEKEISPGAMIAGSMLLGRALAPLDLLIGSWKGFVGARDAYGRLDKLLEAAPLRETPMPLPAPTGQIRMENVTIVPPGSKKPVIAGINLQIEAGQQVAVIGPSAAGKSTLIRTMLGLYKPAIGSVRLDGAEICHWDRELLGSFIGYLPQDVELLDGSISENIARFGPVDPDQVVAAARLAGIHDMLLQLPDGYDTVIQGQGAQLSAGQRQRLGLARALYGSPRIIILDEPNSNLDQDGESALAAALNGLCDQGCTVVMVTHRPSILEQVDMIAFMREGQLAAYGPRDEVLKSLQRAPAPAPAPSKAQQQLPRTTTIAIPSSKGA